MPPGWEGPWECLPHTRHLPSLVSWQFGVISLICLCVYGRSLLGCELHESRDPAVSFSAGSPVLALALHRSPPPSPFCCQACASSHSLCSNLSSTWSLSEFPPLLGGPEAAGEAAVMGGSEPHTSVRHLPSLSVSGVGCGC